MAGRYIGETIRTTYDILNYAKEKQLTGLLLCIDFQKAYDCISFSYIKKVLKFFNFGSDLMKWIDILLNDFIAVVNHCGNISRSFNIGRGCRQGDPIASYLFILCIEILALKLRNDPKVRGFNIGNLRHLLEMYADDITIFLSPTESNLRMTISILKEFSKLSGLRISVEKTHAVWFGKNCQNKSDICLDLGLKWSKSFTLLGIKFTNDLENMRDNFDQNVTRLEKMLDNWRYRYLTPFGKITVLKSLGLSKLSHIALVIPSPDKNMIKKFNSIFFKFIWGSGSEKARREDAKLPVSLGGLSMTDLETFWNALKFSWLRRLLMTSSFWPEILKIHFSEAIGTHIECVTEILMLGPIKLSQLSKKLNNDFWHQVFCIVPRMMDGAMACYPEKFLSSPLFDNNMIVRNSKVLKEADFPELEGKVTIVSDFFFNGTTQLMDFDTFCVARSSEISELKFIDIRYTLTRAIQKLNISMNRLLPTYKPEIPLLINTILLSKRGCQAYYKLLRKKSILNNDIWKREQKWHSELGLTFSSDFWNSARRLCCEVDMDNRLRWLQYQIVRNSLQTNYIVSHFNNQVSSLCQYCGQSEELISHLFWSCNKIQSFLCEIKAFFSSINFDYSPSKIQLLFGHYDLLAAHPSNSISILFKRYVWVNKFQGCNLNIDGFKYHLKIFIADLKYKYHLKEEDQKKYKPWDSIENALVN